MHPMYWHQSQIKQSLNIKWKQLADIGSQLFVQDGSIWVDMIEEIP